jgi:hypothetical protein
MKRITKSEVASKHRQGHGWVTVIYDPTVNSWRESHEMSYWSACSRIRDARETWITKKQVYS